MSVLSELRKRWFVTSLAVSMALFFSGALAYSTLTYVDVIEARQGVELRNAIETVEELDNGSLLVSFSIEVSNPSNQVLAVNSMSWTVRAINPTESGSPILTIASAYNSSSEGIEFPNEGVGEISYRAIVSDPDILETLRTVVNYYSGLGLSWTLETLPYQHDFRLVAYAKGFEHDYQYYKELYLNDIVKIERRYLGGVYL